MPITPMYLAAGCFQMAANIPGMCPLRYRPPLRPMPHSIHMSGMPSSRNAMK